MQDLIGLSGALFALGPVPGVILATVSASSRLARFSPINPSPPARNSPRRLMTGPRAGSLVRADFGMAVWFRVRDANCLRGGPFGAGRNRGASSLVAGSLG